MKVSRAEGHQNIMSESWPSKGKCSLSRFDFPLDKPECNFNSQLLNEENIICNGSPCTLATRAHPSILCSTEMNTYKPESTSLLSTKKLKMIYFLFNTCHVISIWFMISLPLQNYYFNFKTVFKYEIIPLTMPLSTSNGLAVHGKWGQDEVNIHNVRITPKF